MESIEQLQQLLSIKRKQLRIMEQFCDPLLSDEQEEGETIREFEKLQDEIDDISKRISELTKL